MTPPKTCERCDTVTKWRLCGPFGMVWRKRLFGCLIALKSPRWPVLFSERNRRGVIVIPLWRGWRFTIRKTAPVDPS